MTEEERRTDELVKNTLEPVGFECYPFKVFNNDEKFIIF